MSPARLLSPPAWLVLPSRHPGQAWGIGRLAWVPGLALTLAGGWQGGWVGLTVSAVGLLASWIGLRWSHHRGGADTPPHTPDDDATATTEPGGMHALVRSLTDEWSKQLTLGRDANKEGLERLLMTFSELSTHMATMADRLANFYLLVSKGSPRGEQLVNQLNQIFIASQESGQHAELLQLAGARVAVFDPLTDPLPDGTRALVIPGGFPEQFTAELSANAVVREQIAALAGAGAPIHAECAGLTYLVDELDGHPMCGVLPGSARFTERLTLGYRDAVAMVDSSMHAAGERVTGHEFHRTAVDFAQDYPSAWAFRGAGAAPVREGAVHAGVHASYLHTHPAADPAAVGRFAAHAARELLRNT